MKKGFSICDLENVFLEDRNDKGVLIAITGFDGSGKTTQIEAISNEFKKQNREVLLTAQPTAWFRQQSINRNFLINGGNEVQARILALMSAADRLRHVYDVIIPALDEGKVVICDRYIYTTFGLFIHRGIKSSFISEINKGIPKPDYAFYLNVPPEVLKQRLINRDKGCLKHEEQEIDRIASITSAYENMYPHLININGNQEIHQVTRDIMKYIFGTDSHCI